MIRGQIELFKKPIIWHYSLTAIYTECPYCHAHNSENPRTGECRECHGFMDLTREEVKKTKEAIECDKLGLRGAVFKNEKGQWQESKKEQKNDD